MCGDVWWESPSHLNRHLGKAFHHGESAIDHRDQTGAEQLG
jgi:hypothetical protein